MGPSETLENKSTPVYYLVNDLATAEKLVKAGYYTLSDIQNNDMQSIANNSGVDIQIIRKIKSGK